MVWVRLLAVLAEKISVFWHVTSCILVEVLEEHAVPVFYPDDGGITLFRNIFRYQMHGNASQKIVILIITAVRILNLTSR
jgi:hypothetical protein